jgi:predicted RNA-binding protein (virulence factor B family)
MIKKTARPRFSDDLRNLRHNVLAMIKERGGKPKLAPNSQLDDIKLLLFWLFIIIAIAAWKMI